MVLDGIDVFVKVVQAGSFSAAARQLGMPVTTVSAKIARLEERLGVTLIQRSTRRMRVTGAGADYYTHCLDALEALVAGEEQLMQAREEPTGVLRLSAPPDLAQAMLPALVKRFLDAYPRTSIDLQVTNIPVDLLAEGVDLAIRASPLSDSSLQSRKIGEGTLGLFASPGYIAARGTPAATSDLDGHDLLVHSKIGPIVLIGDGNDRLELTPAGRIRADDMQTLRALAAEGAGIALLPDFPGGHGLVRVLPAFATRSTGLYFVHPGGRFTPATVRAFIDLALEGVEIC